MRLLLTGGTGFFGRALLKALTVGAESVEVTVLTRNPEVFLLKYPQWASPAWLRLQAGDVTQTDSLGPLTGRDRFTHVLHAATDSTDAGGLTGLQRMDQIVIGTRNLLEFAAGQGIKRFLLASSGGVYGPQPQNLPSIPETYLGMPDPMLTRSTYGIAKRHAEHLCALYAQSHGLETVVARCFAFVGEDLPLDAHFAIGNFIRDALTKDSIAVNSDGSALRSYLDQRDLAHWLLTMLVRGKAGSAYNVGSDHAVSILKLAHTVRDLLAPQKSVQVFGSPNQTPINNRYIPCISRVRDELGLGVNIGLEDAIRFTARAHMANFRSQSGSAS